MRLRDSGDEGRGARQGRISQPASQELLAAGETATLTVDGMVCGACAARVGRIATQVDGVHDATVDREQGRAQVVYDPARTSPATVARAIAEAGFQTGILP